jgi:hypothetical protein
MKKLSNASETKEISLTIYNCGFGAVKEIRKVNLTGSETELIFADVAQKIETDSLLVEGLNVLEFNYDYDLVDRGKLLQKYIDKEVFLRNRKTGEKKSCRVLSVEEAGKCVLEDNSTKEIYIDTQDEIVLPSLPSGLIVKPALIWKILKSATEDVKVSYLSQGFNWDANYVIEIMGKTLNLAGWAEIENQSGTTFGNAKIKLIAGDVNREEEHGEYIAEEQIYLAAPSVVPRAEEKTFFDYHMYTLLNKTTLKDNQTKQINILNGADVPYKKYYQLNRHEEKVSVIIQFANKKECGLGFAMPKGKIKMYKADEADNSLEFVGEDSIDHTPKDEDIELNIGNAFDITFDFKEVERKKLKGFEYYKYECTIKNHREEEAEVHFEHYIWGIWEMVSATNEYSKKTSNIIEFCVYVDAESDTKVSFEYKIDIRTEVVVKM